MGGEGGGGGGGRVGGRDGLGFWSVAEGRMDWIDSGRADWIASGMVILRGRIADCGLGLEGWGDLGW